MPRGRRGDPGGQPDPGGGSEHGALEHADATGAPAPAPGGAGGPGISAPLTAGEQVTPGQAAEARSIFRNPAADTGPDLTSLSPEDAETMHRCTAMPNAVMVTNPGCVAFMRDHPDFGRRN